MTTNAVLPPSRLASRPPRQRSTRIQHPDSGLALSQERPAGPQSDAGPDPRLSELSVTVRRDATYVVLTVSGVLDTYTVHDFRTVAERHSGTTDDIVIDLDQVMLIDSAGLHTLRTLSNRARASGQRLSLFCQRKHVVGALAIAGLKGSITSQALPAQVASLLAEARAGRIAPQPLVRMAQQAPLRDRLCGSGTQLATAGATPADDGEGMERSRSTSSSPSAPC